MSNVDDDTTLAGHLSHLAADADDVVAMLNAHHGEDGDLNPAALGAAARLQTSLHDVIHALTHHEHLAMSSDDVWSALTVKHQGRDGQVS